MRKINDVRFEKTPDNDIVLYGNEYYLHDNRYRKSIVFPYSKHFKVCERVHIDKGGENYIIFYSPYTTHTGDRHFKPVMTLKDGEYGRIIYNERTVTFDTEWYYIRTTIPIPNSNTKPIAVRTDKALSIVKATIESALYIFCKNFIFCGLMSINAMMLNYCFQIKKFA